MASDRATPPVGPVRPTEDRSHPWRPRYKPRPIDRFGVSGEVKLRPADPADGEYVETLLTSNDLPVADLSGKLDYLFVCETGAGRVGVGGLERRGDVGLVRSVAVEERARGNGYGTTVCEELLARARAADLGTVYLLTTTAEDFFERLGFDAVDREAVPASIRSTSEFADLCPSTAVCMKHDLDGTDDETGA